MPIVNAAAKLEWIERDAWYLVREDMGPWCVRKMSPGTITVDLSKKFLLASPEYDFGVAGGQIFASMSAWGAGWAWINVARIVKRVPDV